MAAITPITHEHAKKPKLVSANKDEAMDRLWGGEKTINSSSLSEELPDGYEWNSKRTKIVPEEEKEEEESASEDP
jgi:hypothetical protein